MLQGTCPSATLFRRADSPDSRVHIAAECCRSCSGSVTTTLPKTVVGYDGDAWDNACPGATDDPVW